MTTATLLMHCKDQQGLVAKVTRFVAENGGNVIDLEQHVDRAEGMFFMRVNWELNGFALAPEAIGPAFESQIATPNGMSWQLHLMGETPRVAVFVSKLAHCFHDLLARWQSGEWDIDIPLVISNHEDMRPVAEQFGLPYYCFPITAENKIEQEAKELELLAEHNIDLVVLARYMQVISPQMIEAYPERIINIHHSFLPAFAGAKPYHAAHARGVKVIGATSHYVTAELDAGPIIEQDVTPISHRDSIETLVRKGRDLEKLVLARGVLAHLQRKTLVYRNRTIVFS